MWDVLETATGARLQSLLFGITTAGFNKEGICYEQRDYAIKVLRGYNSDVEGAVKTTPTLRLFTPSMREMIRLMKRSGRKRIGTGICKRWDDLRRLAKKRKNRSLRG